MFTILSTLGIQEVIVMLSALFCIALPVLLIVLLVKSINKIDTRLTSIEQTNIATEIGKLFMLREEGVISQQEFDDRKSKLLSS